MALHRPKFYSIMHVHRPRHKKGHGISDSLPWSQQEIPWSQLHAKLTFSHLSANHNKPAHVVTDIDRQPGHIDMDNQVLVSLVGYSAGFCVYHVQETLISVVIV